MDSTADLLADRYKPITRHGEGAFGKVVLAIDTWTGEDVAIKRIDVNPHKSANKYADLKKYLETELVHQRNLVHPNIIGLRDVFLRVAEKELCIVLENANGGSLTVHAECHRNDLQLSIGEDYARWFFQQLILALDSMHSQKIYHRDIKPDNLLLQIRPGLRLPRLKVADFGFSKRTDYAFSKVGTPLYIAPEVFHGGKYSCDKLDIWSAGVSLFVLLTGLFPFCPPVEQPPKEDFDMGILTVLQYEQSYKEWLCFKSLTADCQDLLQRMLCYQPSERITLREIQAHSWYNKDFETNQRKLQWQQPPSITCVKSPRDIADIVKKALEILSPPQSYISQPVPQAPVLHVMAPPLPELASSGTQYQPGQF